MFLSFTKCKPGEKYVYVKTNRFVFKNHFDINPFFLLVIPICKSHYNVETQETGESLLPSAQNQHALTELANEGMTSFIQSLFCCDIHFLY